MMKGKSVWGIYLSRNEAEAAASAFKDSGFSQSAISVLLPDSAESEELITAPGTKATEGVAVGTGAGAAVGGTLGWLVGLGALVIPGIGPVIAAGPIVTLLAGIGVGGALGGFAGSLVGVGICEFEAEKYAGRIRDGGILVVAHCENADEVKRAERILRVTGADEISVAGETASDRFTAA